MPTSFKVILVIKKSKNIYIIRKIHFYTPEGRARACTRGNYARTYKNFEGNEKFSIYV